MRSLIRRAEQDTILFERGDLRLAIAEMFAQNLPLCSPRSDASRLEPRLAVELVQVAAQIAQNQPSEARQVGGDDEPGQRPNHLCVSEIVDHCPITCSDNH